MKTSKLILASFLALTAVVNMAFAQTAIRITGSTAYRSAVYQAIQDTLNAGFKVGFTGPTLSSAVEAIFTGSTKTANIAVTIKTAFAGSISGVFSLTTGNGIPDSTATPAITAGFLVDSTATSVLPGAANVPATFEIPAAPAGLDKPGFPNVALSDSFQTSTVYLTPILADTIIGVVPFVWARNTGSPATITNITNQLAKAVLTTGSLPRYQFDNGTDATPIYVTGGNGNSGTRLDAFAESGFGINSVPSQVDTTGVADPLSCHIAGGAWVSGTDGIVFFDGRNGFTSDGQVAAALSASGSLGAIGGYLISYLGIPDSITAVAGGAAVLQYNGVDYSPADVEYGQYSYWSYEHFLKSPQLRAAAGTDPHVIVANALAATLTSDAAVSPAGILLSTMLVSRSAEGAPVF
jgi:hypothetical protein